MQVLFAFAEKVTDIVLPVVVVGTVAVLVNMRPPHCWSKSLKDTLRLWSVIVPESVLEPDRPAGASAPELGFLEPRGGQAVFRAGCRHEWSRSG